MRSRTPSLRAGGVGSTLASPFLRAAEKTPAGEAVLALGGRGDLFWAPVAKGYVGEERRDRCPGSPVNRSSGRIGVPLLGPRLVPLAPAFIALFTSLQNLLNGTRHLLGSGSSTPGRARGHRCRRGEGGQRPGPRASGCLSCFGLSGLWESCACLHLR